MRVLKNVKNNNGFENYFIRIQFCFNQFVVSNVN